MFFHTVENKVLTRKGIDNIYDVKVEVEKYEEISSHDDPEIEILTSLYLQFYDILKDKNRIINCRYKFLDSEILPCFANLVSKTGKKPNRVIISNAGTLEKIKQNTNFMLREFLEDDSNDVVISDAKIENKEFCIFSYKDIWNIGIVCSYDDTKQTYTVKEPIYKDSRYNDSHYNYYYGMKLHD